MKANGIAEPQADGRILLEEATGFTRSGLLQRLDEPLGRDAAERLASMLARRLDREPVFRIIGRREFWGLDLEVTPAVLDPRPDTETVVSAALAALVSRRLGPLRILDLGTGSGAILLALLSELPGASGVGLDRSPGACAVARRNAAACRLADRATIVEGDFATEFSERFDLVVSNPPYIEADAIATLAPEVRDHDPRLALDGGPDGLTAYRTICPLLPRLLVKGGFAVLEVGAGQAHSVAALFHAAGCTGTTVHRDLGGHERAVMSRA